MRIFFKRRVRCVFSPEGGAARKKPSCRSVVQTDEIVLNGRMVMKRGNTQGGLYFLVHFLVEVTSFYVLTCYTQSPYIWVLALIYDFAAFVPQGLFGWLRDRGLYVNFAL